MRDDDSDRKSPERAARGGSARYGKAAGPRGGGHQESKKPERKETQRGFVPRQGGDQGHDDEDGGGRGA